MNEIKDKMIWHKSEKRGFEYYNFIFLCLNILSFEVSIFWNNNFQSKGYIIFSIIGIIRMRITSIISISTYPYLINFNMIQEN